MATAFLIILGLILLSVAVVFIRGFIRGFRDFQPPPPEDLRRLWYDLVYEKKPKPKPKRKYRVLWPPDPDKH